MQKQYITNRKLHQIHFNEQNMYLTKKIAKSKSFINYQCPESYDFYEKEFKKTLPKHKLKDIETNYNNSIIFKKINYIHNISPQTILKIKPFVFSNKKYDGGLTREQRYLMKISNKIYANGIRKQKSVIDNKKMKNDFEKSQKYKKNICKLPVVNFHKVNSTKSVKNASTIKSTIDKSYFNEISLSDQKNAFSDTVFINSKFLYEKPDEKTKNKNNDSKNKSKVQDRKKENENVKENNENKGENNDENKDKAFWVTDLNKENEKNVKA